MLACCLRWDLARDGLAGQVGQCGTAGQTVAYDAQRR